MEKSIRILFTVLPVIFMNASVSAMQTLTELTDDEVRAEVRAEANANASSVSGSSYGDHTGCNPGARLCGGPEALIPVPSKVTCGQGVFTFGERVGFRLQVQGTPDAEETALFKTYLEKLPLGFNEATSAKDAAVVFMIDGRDPKKTGFACGESYSMSISGKRITVKASSVKGCFYAVQSLLIMTRMGRIRDIACCTIDDSPRFGYRGLHFDVSRHFRTKEFLMKQMDVMALFKLNKMHLHLTDGAGWRLQIDAYPRLTEYAAYRPQKRWYDWWISGREYCESSFPGAYGGYYTKEDIREILDYARERNIDVIPEIEMPGHSEEVIASYPGLACEGVVGGSSDFCPGKEETFVFLETVLDEVMEMFPSEYIHIGGDEASKEHWRTCADCQARMKAEGLEDVDQLQSYLIHRIERFVNSRGRKIIGWDEILQGGLAPNATVMSWRGEEGGLKAAAAGHDVVMTPSGYCYLDYSQDAPFKEPVSIGGYLPLSKTYSYEPAHPSLSENELGHIAGIQANLWTEYVVEDSHAEYMYYPRALAVAETAWTEYGRKDYDNFRVRALGCLELLEDMGYETFDLENEYGQRKESLESISHLGLGKDVTYNIPYSGQYPSSGNDALVDGVIGGWTYGDHKWQGFLGDFDVTIDLAEVRPVRYIGATFMNLESAWVHAPASVEFQVSEDGENFRTEGVMYGDVRMQSSELFFKNYFHVCDTDARYIRIVAKKCSRPGAWLFVDEVVIN